MKQKKNDIKASLEEQLHAKGADVACFMDLVDDYMRLWKIKNQLANDISKRGVVYDDLSSVGVPMKKNNQSVKEIVNVNRQMLSLLEKLGLSTETVKANAGGDESDGDL